MQHRIGTWQLKHAFIDHNSHAYWSEETIDLLLSSFDIIFFSN